MFDSALKPLTRQEAGRRLTEAFWAAVQARDHAEPGTPERERAAAAAEELARLMVDFDVRDEIPDADELDRVIASWNRGEAAE